MAASRKLRAHRFLPQMSFFNDRLQGYPFDVDKANALLDEAGYPKKDDGTRFELNLIFIAPPFMPDFNTLPSEFIAASLKKIGVKVKLEPLQGFAGWAKAQCRMGL